MKKTNLIFSVVIIIGLILTSCSKKEAKNDLEIAGLKGKVKSITLKQSLSSDDEMYIAEIHKYNLLGYEVEKEEFYNGEHKEKYTRDNKNNIIEKKGHGVNAEGFNDDWMIKNKFNNQNKLIESTHFSGNKISTINEFKYDDNGNLISDITTYPKEDTDENSTSYKYDENNNIIEMIEKTSIIKKNNPSYNKLVFKYDSNNNKVYESEVDEKGDTGISREFKYDDNNNIIEEKYTYNNGKPFITKYYYNEDKLVEEKLFNKEGSLDGITSYEYDKVGNWIKKTNNSTNGKLSVTVRLIEYYSDDEKTSPEINNPKIEENTEPAKIEEKVSENDNLKTFDEIQLTLIDATIKKAKIYLGEPDKEEHAFGHLTKGFAVYYDKVSNNGKPKHLVLFLRMEGNQWGSNAKIEEIYSVEDNQKACFGIHCIMIKNQTIYTNALDLIIDRGYERL